VTARGTFASFLAANRRLSLAFARVWPGGRHDVISHYKEMVAETIDDQPTGMVVVDVGGGKSLDYRTHVERGRARIIAVDVSAEELRANEDVDETRVADATKHLPFDDAEVDLITSSSVLEHLPDIGAFLDEAARVLRDDGKMIHLFPSRYASFAVLNRVLPEAVKKKLLYGLYPNTKGICGFPAHYDRCYHSAIVRECRVRGFEVEVLELTYYGSSDYYRVFFPVFVASWLWELLASATSSRNLAAAILLKARRLPRSAGDAFPSSALV
jgi:ubiquinone/menaquinone biosynthesis C-methylase UbiE